jgi:hypothetical protein
LSRQRLAGLCVAKPGPHLAGQYRQVEERFGANELAAVGQLQT